MSPDYIYNFVEIDVCTDVSCASSTPLQGSPFLSLPGSPAFRDIATASTGFVRVTFPAIWSGHRQARFVLHYKTDSATFNDNNVRPGLVTNSWHYVSAVVDVMNESTFSASIYVNGTLFAGPVYSFLEDSTGLAFAGQSGIALGRSYPMSAPYGYFMGYMDEFLIIDGVISAHNVELNMKTSCANVPQTLLCITFDRKTVLTNASFQVFGIGQQFSAAPVNQDRFLPWCITRNDGGNLVLNYITNNFPYDKSWGFCTRKVRLPGLAFNYDPEILLSLLEEPLEPISGLLHLKTNLPGCSNFPLVISRNTAGR
jgi:hypothetical protein